jgi:hypothetical protein
MHFDRHALLNTLVDADRATGNPVETKTILAGEIWLRPFRLAAEPVGLNRGNADEKRKRHRAHGDPADKLFGKTKLATEKAVNRSAD